MSRGIRALKTVVCGMSGGVDSAVAAHLLRVRGFNVTGVFMKNWDIANETGHCSADADREDAQYVCDTLRIPLHDVNFVKEYWNEVFTEMIQGYEAGTTPNPDVLCNKYIKFGHFAKVAKEMFGADAMATGHYARNSLGNFLENVDSSVRQKARLLMAVDQWKDQTLFLSQIPQDALQRTMFPVGDLHKNKVKEMALNLGLERIVQKKESMGICFIGSRNFQQFIEDYIEPKPGNFVNIETGEIVGEHKGTHYWTLGQRTHIGGLSKAFFVAKVNPVTQEILVAPGTHHPALFSQTFTTQPPYWIHERPAELTATGSCECGFKFQHVHSMRSCQIYECDDSSLVVELREPMRALTPGQYAVFYSGEECLGSARIINNGPSLYELDATGQESHRKYT